MLSFLNLTKITKRRISHAEKELIKFKERRDNDAEEVEDWQEQEVLIEFERCLGYRK